MYAFPTVFILSVLSLGITTLVAIRFFEERRRKRCDPDRENIEYHKKLYRKMTPAERAVFIRKMSMNPLYFRLLPESQLQALAELMDEWYPQNREEDRIH